jgi:hypothetical protein
MTIASSRLGAPAPIVVRRIRRLAWFGLTACVAVLSATLACGLAPVLQAENDLAILVIVGVNWAIIARVAQYARDEEDRLAIREASARLETRLAVARLANDRIKNKLSLVAGYSEFVVNDSRLPADLRDAAQRALDGAFAAARAVDDLQDVPHTPAI